MTTALITGITGFVGRYLASRLMETGQTVAGFDRWPHFDVPGIAYRPIDILDVDSIAAFIREVKPDRIYHLAAVTFLPDADATPRLALQTNIMGTVSVLDAAVREAPHSRVLLVGSSKEYGPPPSHGTVDEKRPCHPDNFYGISKYTAELIGAQYNRQLRLDVRCSRSFNHTGPGQAPRFVCSDWARQVATMVVSGKLSHIEVGDVDENIDFLDVRDVVEAYRCILEFGAIGGVYNVCKGETVSLRHILEYLLQKAPAGSTFMQAEHRKRKSSPLPLIGDNSRLKHDTNWTPSIPIEKTLDDLVAYWVRELKA